MTHGRDPDVTVSIEVRRRPEDVWVALADPRRFAAWSPEARGVSRTTAPPGPMSVGATFSGANRHGVFRWATRCTVLESSPGTAFAFDVRYLGMKVSRWRYVVKPTDAGSRIDEQWWDDRGIAMRVIATVGTGVRHRIPHNRSTMLATLEAMRRDLEATPT